MKPLPSAPSATTPAVEDAKKLAAINLRKRRGRKATVVAGAQGDTSVAPTGATQAFGA